MYLRSGNHNFCNYLIFILKNVSCVIYDLKKIPLMWNKQQKKIKESSLIHISLNIYSGPANSHLFTVAPVIFERESN